MNQTSSTQPITFNSLIQEIIEGYPQTVTVFNDFNMACPGCHISPFHTVVDGAREHGLHPDELLRSLNNALIPCR